MRRFVVAAVCAASLFGVSANGQPQAQPQTFGSMKGLSQEQANPVVKSTHGALPLQTNLKPYSDHNRGLNARWAKFPGPTALERYYPKDAKKRNVRGVVLAVCDWDAQGSVTGCRTIEEYPAGMGFGEASSKLLMSEGQLGPKTPDTAFEAGRDIAVILRWELY